MLDPFKDEIHRLLREDPTLTGVRVRELLEPLGCRAGKTVVDDYLREVRPLFAPAPRTFARAVWRPGEVCQFDVWQPRAEVPVGHGQTRRGYVVVACLGYSRAGAGVLVFSTRSEDLLAGVAGCLERLGGLPQVLLWDRQAGIHGHSGRPTEAFAAFCGQLAGRVALLRAGRPAGQGAVERLQGYAETNFEPGRRFANELDFQAQLDAWFAEGQRPHAQELEGPAGRSARRRAAGAAAGGDARHRPTLVTRVPPDPYLRVDTNDYSLDPRLVGRRVEVTVDQRDVTAVALDTGELACRHRRVFARHRTITALEHARALRAGRDDRRAAATRSRSGRWPATTR